MLVSGCLKNETTGTLQKQHALATSKDDNSVYWDFASAEIASVEKMDR